MKKFLFFFLILIIFHIQLFSEELESVNQVVLPIEVYVGDQAEIRYTFRTAVDFFNGEENDLHKEIKNPFEGLEDDFSVLKSELYRTGMEYTISFVIVPWKVGTIEFPSFDLNKVLLSSKKSQNENNQNIENQNLKNSELNDTDFLQSQNSKNSLLPEFNILLFPVKINSIVEKTNQHSMMPPVPPIIIPGTTYVIFLFVLFAVIFVILFFRILLKFNSIKQKWEAYLLKRAYKKNAEETIKKIRKLSKSKTTDIEFCSSLQNITRKYLDFRFSKNFSAISSSNIRKVFENLCLGDMPSEIAFAVEDLTAMFIRTDYIRYAHDSIDSQLYPPQEHQASLVKNERKSLVKMVIKSINTFESPNEDDTESEEIKDKDFKNQINGDLHEN